MHFPVFGQLLLGPEKGLDICAAVFCAVNTKILCHMIDAVTVPESEQVVGHNKIFKNFVFIKEGNSRGKVSQFFQGGK